MRREWSTLKKLIWAKASILSGESWTWETLQGEAPLALHNIVSKPFQEFTIYGKCDVINGVISCNNGELVSQDGDLPEEYKRVIGFSFNNNCYFTIPYNLAGYDTVRFTMVPNGACNVFGSYTTTDATNNYSLYITTTSTGKYLRYNGGTYASGITLQEMGVTYNVEITPTGSTGLPRNGTWEEQEFWCSTEMYIGTTSPSSSSSKFVGDLIGKFVVDGSIELIPCERIADGVLGYFDAYNYEFYEPTVGTPTSLGYDEVTGHYIVVDPNWSYGSVGSKSFDLPALLSAGNVKDEYNIVTGVYTQRLETCIIDLDTPEPSGEYITSTGNWEYGAIAVYERSTPNIINYTPKTISLSGNSAMASVDSNYVLDNVIKITYPKGS